MSKMRPLAGKIIVVTRPKKDAARFAARLTVHGAKPYLFPTILVTSSGTDAALRRAVRGAFDWAVFTSVRAVESVVRAGLSAKLHRAKVGVVGPATAAAARKHGFSVDCMPARHTAAALAKKISNADGARVLFPCSSIASRALPTALKKRGATVVAVVAYATVHDTAPDPAFVRMARRGTVDHIVFASPSAVAGFAAKVQNESAQAALRNVSVVAIGPATARAARARGFTKVTVAKMHTEDGLLQTLIRINTSHG